MKMIGKSAHRDLDRAYSIKFICLSGREEWICDEGVNAEGFTKDWRKRKVYLSRSEARTEYRHWAEWIEHEETGETVHLIKLTRVTLTPCTIQPVPP